MSYGNEQFRSSRSRGPGNLAKKHRRRHANNRYNRRDPASEICKLPAIDAISPRIAAPPIGPERPDFFAIRSPEIRQRPSDSVEWQPSRESDPASKRACVGESRHRTGQD